MNAQTPFFSSAMTVVGVFSGWSSRGQPMIAIAGNRSNLKARTIVALDDSNIGQEVLVQSLSANSEDLVVLGLLQAKPRTGEVTLDNLPPQPLDLTAQNELTLRCGKASITLTKEGKIILRGTYISSRSSGANRIKGGSVHLN